jgi:hypothetical protein
MNQEEVNVDPRDVMLTLEAQRNAAQTALAVVEARNAALTRLVAELRAQLANGKDDDV